MLFALAWRNLWRQPRRTLLNVTSIAFAALVMVFLLSLQLGVYATMKENVLRLADGFAQIQPPEYRDSPDLEKVIEDPESLLTRLSQVPEIDAAAPRAIGFSILSVGEKSIGAAVVGIDPGREPGVSTLGRNVDQGRFLEPGDGEAIVLGAALARSLDASVGSAVTLIGGTRDGGIAADVLTVVGIFETGTAEVDREIAQVPLRRFQETFGMGTAVNTLALSGPTLAGVSEALPALRRQLEGSSVEVLSWQELQPGLDAAITLDLNTSLMWYASLVIVVVFIILNTLLMSVLERTREFGVLLAIGMRPARIGAMIWMELALLAVVGLAIGIGLGSVITLLVGQFGIELPGAEAIFSRWGMPGRLFPRLSGVSMAAGPTVMALGILLSGILPYRRVRRLKAVAAMREV